MNEKEGTNKDAKGNLPGGWPFMVLAASIALFFGTGLWTGAESLFTHDLGFSDQWHFHVPLKKLYSASLISGELPWWSHMLSTGFPLVAEGQVGALYPPHLALFSLFDFTHAMGLALVLHLLWGSSGVFVLSRHWGFSTGAALLGGLVFSTCGFMVVHAKHLNMVEAAAWLPWVILEVRRLCNGESTGVRLALAVAMSFLCGHPQITYYTLLVGGCVALGSLPWRHRSAAWNRLGRGIIALVCAGLLTAPQSLATSELAEISARGEGLSANEISQWSYSPEFLQLFWVPDAFGDPAILAKNEAGQFKGFTPPEGVEAFYWEVTGYVGLIPWMLCLFLLLRPQRRGALPFFAMGAGGFLMLLAPSLGLGDTLATFLPGYDLFRFHSRWLLLINLALALLAAAGTDALIKWLPDHQRKYAPGLIALLLLVTWSDTFMALGHHNPTIAPEKWLEAPDSVTHIQSKHEKRDLYRVVVQDPGDRAFLSAYGAAKGWTGDLSSYHGARAVIRPNLGALYDINTLFYYFHLAPVRMKAGLESTLMPGGNIHPGHAGRLNVRYLLAAAPRTGNPEEQCLGGGPGTCVQVLPNPRVKPRFHLAGFAHVVPPGDQALDQSRALLMGPQFNLDRDVVLEGPGILAETNTTSPLEGNVRVDTYDHQDVALTVRASRPAWLVTSDTWYPGWEASVDGVATPIYPANLSGRAILVPAGTHQVRFTYTPTSYVTGWLLLALGVLMLIGLKWMGGRNREPLPAS